MAEIREYNTGAVEAGAKKSKRLKKNLIIFGCIIAGLIIIGAIGSNIKGILHGDDPAISANGPYIATLHVEGSILSGQTDTFGIPVGYQHQWTLGQLSQLITDPDNKGLIVFINSPGGGVYESDELYLKLNEYKKATGRPVYAVMGSMAASGGYYIATSADKIFANRNTWTGSIGVTIGTLYDISGLLERYGVKTETITAGANKAMGSSVEPLTGEQKAIFQSLVDEAYEQFIGIVSNERGIDLSEVRKLADGRIYTAKQALALGLVDKIGTMDDAVRDISRNYDLQDCDVIDVVYQDDSFLGSLLSDVRIPDFGGGDVSSILKVVKGNSQLPISYECELLDQN